MFWRPESSPQRKNQSLEQALLDIQEWTQAEKNELSSIIVEELKLDDYVFQTYTKHDDSVTLYVGFYFTGKKVGAAHDPQVCYPGQGWKLTGKDRRSYSLGGNGDLDYSRVVADLNGNKEEIYYWFQVDNESVPNTFLQKISLLKKKLLQQGENNAFVRISTSLNNKSEKEAQRVMLDFVDKFYPLFVDYIRG